MDRLDPSNDVVFKILFKDPEAERRLIAMLTAILAPSSPIVSARVLNPHLPADLSSGKAVVLDLLVVLGDGRRVCIELEARPRRVLILRDLLYWARAHSGQLDAGENYASGFVMPFGRIDSIGSRSRSRSRVNTIRSLRSGEAQ